MHQLPHYPSKSSSYFENGNKASTRHRNRRANYGGKKLRKKYSSYKTLPQYPHYYSQYRLCSKTGGKTRRCYRSSISWRCPVPARSNSHLSKRNYWTGLPLGRGSSDPRPKTDPIPMEKILWTPKAQRWRDRESGCKRRPTILICWEAERCRNFDHSLFFQEVVDHLAIAHEHHILTMNPYVESPSKARDSTGKKNKLSVQLHIQ